VRAGPRQGGLLEPEAGQPYTYPETMEPFADDDTCPSLLPVHVAAGRSFRPGLARVSGPGRGETYAVPTDRRAGLVIGRGGGAAIQVADPAVSREHCRVWCAADGSMRVTDLGSTNGTIVNGKTVREAVLAEGDKIQVGAATVFRFSLNDRLDEDYAEHLYHASIRDALTGLLNRRYLSEALERDLALAKRHAMPISLILLDVDRFKTINDTFGHRGGDAALVQLARLLSGMQRKESLVARYGGEEFAVLLRNVAPAGAEVFAERMRIAVERARFDLPQGPVSLTVSIGMAVSSLDDAEDPDTLIEKADRYLYLSKTRGRNCMTSIRTFSA
jgi:two-component system cell cycle response regulator